MYNTIWSYDPWFPKLGFIQTVAYFLIILKYHWVIVSWSGGHWNELQRGEGDEVRSLLGELLTPWRQRYRETAEWWGVQREYGPSARDIMAWSLNSLFRDQTAEVGVWPGHGAISQQEQQPDSMIPRQESGKEVGTEWVLQTPTLMLTHSSGESSGTRVSVS